MASWRLISALLASVVVATTALPAEQPGDGRSLRNQVQTESDLMESIYADCLRKDSMSCVKYKLFTFVDKMLTQKDTFQLTEGVTVVKTTGADTQDGAPRAATGDDTVESLLMSRVQRFLETHTLKVDLKGSDVMSAVASTGRALEDLSDSLTEEDGATQEGRGKKKKASKLLGPLMAALAMKAAALVPLALGAIALIAGKALLVGKIALVLSAIIGLKKLFSGQGKHVTYEVVSHPHHSSSHVASHDSYGGGGGGGGGGYGGDVGGGYSGGGSSGHGGWGRSLEGQNLAYRAHTQ